MNLILWLETPDDYHAVEEIFDVLKRTASVDIFTKKELNEYK